MIGPANVEGTGLSPGLLGAAIPTPRAAFPAAHRGWSAPLTGPGARCVPTGSLWAESRQEDVPRPALGILGRESGFTLGPKVAVEL